ncbi:MAG: NnrS family protein [Sulfurovum sp.]|nr:NnrS family protein [Sulfurovum sp.]NNJ44525.1 NnrS family protein [Sulfurovum sp.]
MKLQFTENSENKYFFSQPHQPFFVLGFINAIVTIIIFMLAYKGVYNLALTASNFHIYALIYLMFTPVFFGFIFTGFLRLKNNLLTEKKLYMRIFSLYYLGAILFLLGSIVSPFLSAMGMFLVFSAHLMGIKQVKKIYTVTTIEDRPDIFWIFIAMVIGLLSHLLFIIAQIIHMPLMSLSNEIAVYLYLFFLTFAIAQRMVPYFSDLTLKKNNKLLKIVFSLLSLHIIFESIYPNSSYVADLILAYFIGKELLRWKLPFPNPEPLLWILYLSLFWIPVGFFLGAVTNFISTIFNIQFLSLDTHVITLGFVLTILLGFGTRITLRNSDNPVKADKWTTYLFYWTQLVIVTRIFVSLASAFESNIMILFDISVSVWVLMFILWGLRFFKVLITGKQLPC